MLNNISQKVKSLSERNILHTLILIVSLVIVLFSFLILFPFVKRPSYRYSNYDIVHRNALDSLYTSLQAYYTDYREFPIITDFSFSNSCGTENNEYECIDVYFSPEDFNGGSSATFYYLVSDDLQYAVICISLGGLYDTEERGFYCSGYPRYESGSFNNLIGDIENRGGDISPNGIEDWTLIQNWIKPENASKGYWEEVHY